MADFSFAQTETITVKEKKINVRSGPGTNYSIIASIKEGETYSVEKREGEWIQIVLDSGEKAWVANWVVSLETVNTLEAPSVTITASSLIVRDEPAYSGKKIGTVQKEESYSILQEKNNWYQIQLSNKKKGWIPTWYTNAILEADTSVSKESKVTMLYDDVPIRKTASTDGEIGKLAAQNKEYKVTSITDDMYEISYNLWKTGYISNKLVTANEETTQFEQQTTQTIFQNKTIVIDPGHGGNDSGTIGANGTLEKELALQTAQLLKTQLENVGATVIITRKQDYYLSLSARVNSAHLYNADAFISIHYDSAAQDDVRGITQYYYHYFQKELALEIDNSLQEIDGLKNRGVHFGNYQVLRHNSQPSVLLELGYLSNPEEEAAVISNDYQQTIVMAIFNGLGNYFSK